MKIVLSGYYGYENTGDEALLEILIKTFKKQHPQFTFTVLSNRPEQTEEKLKVPALGRYNLASIRETIKKCDVFISGAGGLIQDKTSFRSLTYYLGLILLAKFYGKPVVIFASGLGPLRSGRARFLCKKILSQVDLLLLRDNPSYKLAKELLPKHPRLFETGDLGALFAPVEETKILPLVEAEKISFKEHPVIGISIRDVSFHAQRRESFYRSFARSLDILCQKLNAKLLFLLFQCPQDIDATSRIIDYLKSPYKIIFRELAPREILGVISKTDLFIGMRLHSLIFAAISSVPALGISYDPKVAAFMQSVGLPFLNPRELEEKTVLNLLENLQINTPSIKEQLKNKKERLKAQARFNFILFDKFIDQGQTQVVLNVKIHNLTIKEMRERIRELIRSNQPHYITTPNPEIIVQSQTDLRLREAINNADLNLADGAGLVVLSRFIGKPIKERLSGIDALYEIVKIAARENYPVFLLGGAPGTAESAAEELKKAYPKLNISGTHHGYFKEAEDKEIIALVKKVKPAILFVGIGAPRQEKWLAKHYKELGVPVSMGVGGSFDIIAGRKRRAPKWIQNLNAEWVYRLFAEPKRWKRQISLIQFMFLIGQEIIRLRKSLDKARDKGEKNERTKHSNGHQTSRDQTV